MKVVWIVNAIVVVFAWLTLGNPWLSRSRGRGQSRRAPAATQSLPSPPSYVAYDLHYNLPPSTMTQERRASVLTYQRSQDTRLEYALKVGLLFVIIIVLVYINV